MKRIGRVLLCILMITVLCGISVVGNSVVKSENKSKEKKRTAITKEEMKEWAAPDEESLESYDLGKFSTTLPVVYMNTMGQQVLKENAIWGNIALLDGNGEEQSVFSVPNSIYRATIKYRGASSYSKFDKKQYRIKFYKNKKDSAKKVSLAGMGANSEWVLNGPYLDKTLIRNKLVYDLARELNGWAPDSRFVELFVDGEYQGVYLAVEPVTNGESRLRLSEFGLLSGETAYILNRDRIDTGSEEIETWGKTKGYTYNALYIRYPSKNKITEKQKEYIKNDISEFEQVLYGENFSDYKADVEAPLPMIYQSGYLTIKDWNMDTDSYLLDFPNDEVRSGFLTLVASSYLKPSKSTDAWVIQVIDVMSKGDCHQLENLMTSFFASIPYNQRRKDDEREKERYFQYTFYLVLRMISCFTVFIEKQQSEGRVDCVVVTPNYIYIFEFKRDGSAEEALKQIEDMGYAREYAADGRKIYQIGCNFSSKTGTIDGWKMK